MPTAKWLWRFCIEDMALWRRFITKNMGCSINGQLRQLWVLLDVVYGKPSEDYALNSMSIFHLEWEMELRLIFGMSSYFDKREVLSLNYTTLAFKRMSLSLRFRVEPNF